MKCLNLNLKISDLGERTHVWFPAPVGDDQEIKTWFSVQPTGIQTDEEYGNKIAYFYFLKRETPLRSLLEGVSLKRIEANFSINVRKVTSVDPRRFLLANRFVESDDTAIKKLASILTVGSQSDQEKVRQCFDFVINYLTYANPIRGLYSSIQALTDRQVDCGGFATLLVALSRAAGVPARCVFGWAIKSKFGYHAWAEYFDPDKNKWIPMDPSVAQLGKRTKLDAGFGFINDERIILSVGEDIKLKGNDEFVWSTPLLQSPISVTLSKNNIPQLFHYDLTWKVL